jgi:hypothetical protein
MSSEEPTNPMAESGVTVRSDSEQYSGAEEVSMSPPSSGSPALILYQPPTIWGLIRGAAINLLLPFINGMMLGFGELFAHEAAYRLGWGGTRVRWWHSLLGKSVFASDRYKPNQHCLRRVNANIMARYSRILGSEPTP